MDLRALNKNSFNQNQSSGKTPIVGPRVAVCTLSIEDEAALKASVKKVKKTKIFTKRIRQHLEPICFSIFGDKK